MKLAAFHASAAPLAGANLVEASAGTGKTYAIATLFVRFVAERGIGVADILVVTYTRAATAELRDRIRSRLRQAYLAVVEGQTKDKGLAPLLATWRGSDSMSLARRRLERALRDFDRASIFTIHSFCQRVLKDSAFESGASFDAEFLTEEGPLLDEIVHDFWTTHTSSAPKVFIRSLLDRKSKFTPETLRRLANKATAYPGATILPAMPVVAPVDSATWNTAVDKVVSQWQAGHERVASLLLEPKVLHQGSYKAETIETEWLPAIASAFEGNDAYASVPVHILEKLTPERLKQKTNKARETPSHPFFDACAELVGVTSRLAADELRLCLEMMAYARTELAARKRALDVMSFDDLLVQLRNALADAKGGPALAAAIRDQYPAALIDEFQDTDSVQYEVFRAVYKDAGRTSKGLETALFLIGDPKQAIYGFRGADVFAYMNARAELATRQYTLDTNWRSDARLIDGVNTLFDRRSPFLFAEISFQPVKAANTEPRLGGVASADAPLRIAVVGGSDDAGAPEKEGAPAQKAAAINFVVTDMLRLLESDSTIDGAPISPGHFAVLCRSNRETREMQDALRRAQIPSVVEGEESVFDAAEAASVERLLTALLSPGDMRAVKAALATDLFGWTADRIAALGTDELLWDAWSDRFREWHRLWIDHGFIQAFRGWMSARAFVAPAASPASASPQPSNDPEGRSPVRLEERLLGFVDGERRLTNLYHLGELLQAEASTSHLGPQSLIRWLRTMIGDKAARADSVGETSQLRLESDADAVKLVTIHRSKGLEYPMVYCPFLWAGQLLIGDDVNCPRFHDEAADNALTMHIGYADKPEFDAAKRRAEREALAEQLRLLYVAVTRARHGCTVVYARTKGSANTALSYLLHHGDDIDTSADGIHAALTEIGNRSGDVLLAELLALQAATKESGSIGVVDVEEAQVGTYAAASAATAKLVARTAARQVRVTERIASFTGLASARAWSRGSVRRGGVDDGATAADHDGGTGMTGRLGEASPRYVAVVEAHGDLPSVEDLPTPDDRKRLSLADFPRGAKAGHFFHAILEKIDFAAADPGTLEPLVAENLKRFGFMPALSTEIAAALADMVATPLPAPGPGCALAQIPNAHRLNELEFLFPVGRAGTGLTAPKLASVIRAKGDAVWADAYAQQVAELGFSSLTGYLRGFADLVFVHEGRFYLVDHKSNYLGPSEADYAPAQLVEPMLQHHYVLQYLIYTVALDRYLRHRVAGYSYETHFGGVMYLFLRGMRPSHAPGTGVFFDRPPAALIQALSELMSAGDGTGAGYRQ